ncbi:Tak1 [Symbiodinium sp. KB8]|nr:Tak1 [Symbiodinium sp. KB8]
MRKQARREWESKRIQQATQGDWAQVRKLRSQRNTGWDTHYAEQQPEGEAHDSIHNHLSNIYQTGQTLPELGPWTGEAQAFTEDELRAALAAGGKGKAVGVDLTSHELLQGICDTPGGFSHLLEFFNKVFCTAEVPSDWNRALMLVIPKVSLPTEPGDLRPLAMGSAAAKVFARMCWYNLLRNTDAVLQTDWDSTIINMQGGIKQGAIESPAFFSFLAETCLHEASQRYEWHKEPNAFEGLDLNNLLYMDDGLMWSKGMKGIEARVAQWGAVLQEFGLRINAKKCQLYVSPYHTGKRTIRVQGEVLHAAEDLKILGLTYRDLPWASLRQLSISDEVQLYGHVIHDKGFETQCVPRVKPFMMIRIVLGIVPLALLCAGAPHPQGTEGNLHMDAKFGAYATFSKLDGKQGWMEKYSGEHLPQGQGKGEKSTRPPTWKKQAKIPSHRDRELGPATWLAKDKPFNTKGESEDPDVDEGGLMQVRTDDNAWYAFLQGVRTKIDEMPKVKKASVIRGLLRLLDWTCRNSQDGYLLGHTGGRTAEMLSILVALRDDVEADPGSTDPEELEGIWKEATLFLEVHPGSVPSEFLTPGVSPEEIPEKPSAKKQRRFRLEMEVSSGSGDHPCQRLSLPLSENSEGVTVRFAISGESESETEAAESCAPEGIALPQAAPGRLGELGLSHGDMTDLHDLWCRGELTLQTIAQDHGREAADLLRGMWETNLPSQAGGRQGEDDETALLTLQVSMLMATRIGWGVAMEHEDPTMAILREHLLRQRGEGTTIREQSSTLYSIIQNRQVPAYMDEFPDLMHELGLEVDVNLHARCLPGPTPFYTWVEEELWQLFQDRFEATMGFETEQTAELDYYGQATGGEAMEAAAVQGIMIGGDGPGEGTPVPIAAVHGNIEDLSQAIANNTMVNALMRLMGMMYIELARILITQWGKMLMELVALAEDATNNGLLMALKRRISSSLYLQTAKGAQLQAALVAATGVAKDDAESCDTSDNDYGRAEDWWKRLKQHMDLSDPGEGGASSQEPMRVPHLPAGEYTDEQVQCWEAERQGLLREQAAELEDQLKYEKEEAEALEQDERRWEQHAASSYRDWEQWVVLNTPTVPKRRRLTIEAHGEEGTSQSMASTAMPLPKEMHRLDRFHVTLRVDNVPETESTVNDPTNHVPLDVTGKLYTRAYEAWRAGAITNAGVEAILGPEWLFMFQVNMAGVPGDTLAAGEGPNAETNTGQVGSVGGQLSMGENGPLPSTLMDGDSKRDGQWGRELRGQVVALELEDSVEDAQPEGHGDE